MGMWRSQRSPGQELLRAGTESSALFLLLQEEVFAQGVAQHPGHRVLQQGEFLLLGSCPRHRDRDRAPLRIGFPKNGEKEIINTNKSINQ